MDARQAARFLQQQFGIDLSDWAEFVHIVQGIPWVKLRKFVKLVTVFDGLNYGCRSAFAAFVFLVFLGAERHRRAGGRRQYERWTVHSELLTHCFFVTLLGPVYLLIFACVKLVIINRFATIRSLMVVIWVLLTCPTLLSWITSPEAATAASYSEWISAVGRTALGAPSALAEKVARYLYNRL